MIKVSIDTLMEGESLTVETIARIEGELEIKAYIQDLKFALKNGAKINFQAKRRVELTLSVEDYMQTVKDLRFPKRSDMREFGKVYNGGDDVYIKIRVELLGMYGNSTTFVMSFHFAEKAFTPELFPYRKNPEVLSWT